jgi:hypothetical protein
MRCISPILFEPEDNQATRTYEQKGSRSTLSHRYCSRFLDNRWVNYWETITYDKELFAPKKILS